MLFDDRQAATETLSALSAKPDITHAVIYDKQGGEFAAFYAPGHAHSSLLHATWQRISLASIT